MTTAAQDQTEVRSDPADRPPARELGPPTETGPRPLVELRGVVTRAGSIVPVGIERGRLRPLLNQGARRLLPWIPTCAPLVLGLELWALSLHRIKVTNLTDYGLPPVLPIGWYLALALLVIGAAITLCQRRVRPWLLVAYVIAFTLVLYATVPLVSPAPQYNWVYKHLGVVQYIELHGRVKISVDIYHRWPGFFALSAVFSRLAGKSDPVAFAAWAEVFFTLIDTVLIAAITRTLFKDVRAAGAAALIFVITNWVGQNYFSPQAFCFVLMLGVYLIVARELASAKATRIQRILNWSSHLVLRARVALPDDPPEGSWPRAVTITLVVVLTAAITVSHQLTPYLLLVGVTLTALVGYCRPRWLPVVLAVVVIGYLVPNLTYVDQHYGIFSSIDPFRNVQTDTLFGGIPEPGKTFNATTSRALSFGAWGLAAVGVFRLLRRGDGRALVIGPLAISSVILVFGQSYGGEAILRVILFSLPWCAMLVYYAIAPRSGQWRMRRMPLVAATLGALVALFIPSYFGQTELNIMPSDEVAASQYLYAHGQAGSLIMGAAPNFPTRYGGTYDRFTPADTDSTLLDDNTFRGRKLGPADVPAVVRQLASYHRNVYLIFATTETTAAEVLGITPPGAIPSLEKAVATSGQFTVWYSSPNARIYQLTPAAAAAADSAAAATRAAGQTPAGQTNTSPATDPARTTATTITGRSATQ